MRRSAAELTGLRTLGATRTRTPLVRSERPYPLGYEGLVSAAGHDPAASRWLSRPGARCRIALGPFPQAARRTRRAGLPAAGSPRSLPLGVVEGGPWAGDLAAAVEVPGDRHRAEVEQFDPVRRWPAPPADASGFRDLACDGCTYLLERGD